MPGKKKIYYGLLSLIAGCLSCFPFVYLVMPTFTILVMPLFGVTFGIAALIKIRSGKETYGGKPMAIIGIIFSILGIMIIIPNLIFALLRQ